MTTELCVLPLRRTARNVSWRLSGLMSSIVRLAASQMRDPSTALRGALHPTDEELSAGTPGDLGLPGLRR